MGRLTTHVLDTARGRPAAGLHIRLDWLADGQAVRVGEFTTNDDGRVDRPLLEGADLKVGEYELVFAAGRYFARHNVGQPGGPFLGDVPVRFHVADATAHYHVPLLLSPYGYSTYRGS
jgi:5-hydroxyisourate hydrolase